MTMRVSTAVVLSLLLGGCSLLPPRHPDRAFARHPLPGDWATYRSTSGAPISVKKFGEGPCRVLILAGTHGDEEAGVAVAKRLPQHFAAEPELLKDVTFLLVDTVNPDGLERGTRVNANGIDVNRNFPGRSWSAAAARSRYNPGKKPASEVETRSLMHLLYKARPSAIISLHAPLACVNWDGPADDLAKRLSEVLQLPLKPSIGYATPGSLGNYAGVTRRIPVVTLELPRHVSDPETFAAPLVRSFDGAREWCR